MLTRLLLVDDHPVVRAGYQRLLEQDGDMVVVAQAGAADEACALFASHAPDLTITDLAMPGSGGLELIRRLRARQPDARVLVFSMHDSELLVRRAFDIGACGFVSKTSAPEQLLTAVRHAISGRSAMGGRDAGQILLGGQAHGAPDSPLAVLTARELEVFGLLACGRSLADCARSLHLSPKTVANHQSLIKEKLGVATTAAMAHLAIRHGLIAAGIG